MMVFNGCGYRLAGHGKQIPDHIKSIFIPDFENKTTRFQAEHWVTTAVREEFIQRSNLKLVSRDYNADAILEGEILSFKVKGISYSDEVSANLYQVSITLSVRFIDLKDNKIIFESERIKFSDSYDIDDQDSDFFSQETDTLIDIAERFADSVVTTILENF